MIQSKGDDMGRFSVEVELANNYDLDRARAGIIPETQVRRVKLRGVVDTGATRLVLPGSIADRLGLRTAGWTTVRYADGRVGQRGARDRLGGLGISRSGVPIPFPPPVLRQP